MRPLCALVLALLLPACSTYKDDLARSQHAFEQNQHERALAILRMLELDTSHLDRTDQAHYAYLRGMTDFRIGYKADARHWLAVAKQMDEKTPGSLSEDWRTRLDQALAELDATVWTTGMESLSVAQANVKRAGSGKHKAKKPEPAAEESGEEQEEQAPAKPAPKKPKPADDEDE